MQKQHHLTLVHITTVPQTFAFLRGQVGYMSSHGFHIEAISSSGEYAAVFAAEEGIRVHAVEMKREVTPCRDLLVLWRIFRVLRGLRPVIVHAHTPKGGLLGMISAWLAGVPIRFYHIRGLPFATATGGQKFLLRWTERVACALAHRVLAVSHSMRRIAIQEGLCPSHKIAVPLAGSGNGVDAEVRFNPDRLEPTARLETRRAWNIPEEATVVGFAGRLVRDKGIVELAEAWRQLREEYPDLHLLLVGPFEPRDPVPPETVALLQSDPRIHLTGQDRNTPPLYSAMDIVALPSYREGFPNVPLEASAMNLPVVASRIPGCTDAIIDGKTGTLVMTGDVEVLTQALRNYIDDVTLRRRHGEAGRERVLREFRPELVWRAVYEEYVRHLRTRGLHPLSATTDGSKGFGTGGPSCAEEGTQTSANQAQE